MRLVDNQKLLNMLSYIGNSINGLEFTRLQEVEYEPNREMLIEKREEELEKELKDLVEYIQNELV